jgi:hypothetical protein
MTVNVFLERTFDAPLTPQDVVGSGRHSAWCFELHRVQWHGSFLARDGRALVCRFEAPDLESARIALRTAGADVERMWLGSVAGGGPSATANVVVARPFPAPARFEDVAALEKAKAWCLEAHRVAYSHTYYSRDGTRMLCFYAAPDAEAVRFAQREAEMPHDAVWAGVPIEPAAPVA